MKDEDLFSLEEQPSSTTFKDYKEKLTKNPHEGVIMFISAFFVMLLLFLGIAKQISPEVDVAIGNDSQNTEFDANEYASQSIDERLKLIQMEDAGASQDSEEGIFDESLEERVVLPDSVKKIVEEDDIDSEVSSHNEKSQKEVLSSTNNAKPVENIQQAPVTPVDETPVTLPAVSAKVVVGYYATVEQAQVAKGILLDAGLNISPFVKQIGGAYTIQVGSFSSREKAQTVANELLRNNFPARVIVEQ